METGKISVPAVLGGLRIGIAALAGLDWAETGRASEMHNLITADVFIGLMLVGLTASSLFYLVAEQTANTARDTLIGIAYQRIRPDSSMDATMEMRAASLSRVAFLFLFGFLYALAGLITHLGFETLITNVRDPYTQW